ncbi:MAG: hypothetical protein QG673_1179 [Pseudomonadota bacterium]|nr:hypothetical protein [Pseudomonadota bacterium]
MGLGSYTQTGAIDLFLAKYDANGKVIWLNQSGTPNKKTIGNGITMTTSGVIYVTGSIASKNFSSLDWTTNSLFYQYSSGGLLSSTTQDSYAAASEGLKIGADSSGNAYIVGNILEHPSGQNYEVSNNYINKFTPNNVLSWAVEGGF